MNIIELAKQAELYLDGENTQQPLYVLSPSDLERFAALIRAQTLEEAAEVCENTLAQHYMKQVIPTHDEALLLAACADCAAAIRAMKEQT